MEEDERLAEELAKQMQQENEIQGENNLIENNAGNLWYPNICLVDNDMLAKKMQEELDMKYARE